MYIVNIINTSHDIPFPVLYLLHHHVPSGLWFHIRGQTVPDLPQGPPPTSGGAPYGNAHHSGPHQKWQCKIPQ